MFPSRIPLRATAAAIGGLALALTSLSAAQASPMEGTGISSAATVTTAPAVTHSHGTTGVAPLPTCTWDLQSDFLLFSGQLNPSPDNCGHTGVWYYLTGVPGTLSSYTQLAYFNQAEASIPLNEGWADAAGLPHISVNESGAAINVSSGGRIITVPNAEADMHPFDVNHAAIVGWHSPITSRGIKVTANLSLAESPNCGNGIAWSLWENATLLQSGTVVPGSPAHVSAGVAVTPSDALYLAVDSIGGNYVCDTTVVDFTLIG